MSVVLLAHSSLLATARKTLAKTLTGSRIKWTPPPRMAIADWARRYRYLSAIEAARPGKYQIEVTPYLAWPNGPLEALDDPKVVEVVCQKSAQVAWTSGVLGNALAKWIDIDPSPILVLFPKEGAAKEYMAEKFEPMVEATPRLRAKIDLRSRRGAQRQLFKRFPGGFLKLVGSNSPASVKSTPVPRVAVEEPDDCNLNLRGQGDSIKLAKERNKTYARPKTIIGGTPTIAGLSAIAAEMELSDQRVGMIPCHACGESHALSFDYLTCLEDKEQQHAVFGSKLPNTAYYTCPHCGVHWDDTQKNANVRRGRWVATAPFHGIAGFYLNELYSPFPGSVMRELMKKWLTAQHSASMGDIGPLIAFVNSSQGLCYEFKGDTPDPKSLQERALDYAPGSVPRGGLLLTAGIDVQPDRLEIVIRAWGRGEESWLVRYLRLYGAPGLIEDPVWSDLDGIVFAKYRAAMGAQLALSAISIDSSDGNTSDAVYKWVRSRQRRGVDFVMAIKGSSQADAEIFAKPTPPKDTNRRNTKASKYGLQVYMVGVSRAKDLLIGTRGRTSLTGVGPGRFHTYRDLSAEYYEQLLDSEVKAPIRSRNGHVMHAWQKRTGRRNEVLDCEVYALHASRAAKVHIKSPAQWDLLQARLAQAPLFEQPEPLIGMAGEVTQRDAAETPAFVAARPVPNSTYTAQTPRRSVASRLA